MTLPPEVDALADWAWGEPAFRRADLERVAELAARAGIACEGGQVQLRWPEATAELFWRDYDPTPRRQAETWPDYVARSWKEVLFLIESLPDDASLAAEAVELQPSIDARSDDVRFVLMLRPPSS